ncbi:MAG TPA: ribonuclease H [Opitutae bacterium]|jgi:ribonuclease HI|nr:ribonuclease H [Opitutae bacterium]
MSHRLIFTDGSVHTQSGIGYGAALALSEHELAYAPATLKPRVVVRKFTDTSSTKMELQTLLWALSDLPTSDAAVIVYTDSQNIISLPGRRSRFEAHDYHSQKGLPLRNAELYQAFFRLYDRLNVQLVKVKGHKAAKQKDPIDRIFTLVDRASRNAHRHT